MSMHDQAGVAGSGMGWKWTLRREGAARGRTAKTTQLIMEVLEDRLLPSVAIGLPRRPSLEPGGADASPVLALFESSLQGFRPLSGQDQVSSQLDGTFTNAVGGSYTLALSLAGTTPGGTSFAASASGLVSFSLDAAGSVNQHDYAVASVALAQSAPLSFSFEEWQGSTLVRSDSGGTNDHRHAHERSAVGRLRLAPVRLGAADLGPFDGPGLGFGGLHLGHAHRDDQR